VNDQDNRRDCAVWPLTHCHATVRIPAADTSVSQASLLHFSTSPRDRRYDMSKQSISPC
jgi:hypothetical protein